MRRISSAPTLDQLWSAMAWLIPGAAVLLATMPVTDLAYQLRAGALMIADHRILRADPFTFTVGGQPWTDQQWGAQVVLDVLHAPAGWAGLVVVRAALVALAFGVVFVWTRRSLDGDGAIAMALTGGGLLVAIFMPGALALRPQLLAVPLFLGSVWVLRERHRRPRLLWWLPVIGVVWANVHGSFLLLGLVATIAAIADLVARRPLAAWTALAAAGSFVVALANPWGFGIYRYVAAIASSTIVTKVIDEWLPLWRQWPAGLAFLVALVAAITLVLFRSRRRPNLEEALGMLAFSAIAVWSGRNVLWWSLYVPPVLGRLVRPRAPREPERSPMTATMLALMVGLVVVGLIRVATVRPAERLLADAPPGVTSALATSASPGDRVFVGWWRSWLEYRVPDVQLFVDARAEIFPEEVWDTYFDVSGALPGWEGALDRWQIDTVVASWDHQGPLIEAMSRSTGWREVYRGSDGVVFVRS
jgi:hypothetical protein